MNHRYTVRLREVKLARLDRLFLSPDKARKAHQLCCRQYRRTVRQQTRASLRSFCLE